jgi:heptosyltransferase-1
MTLPSVLGLKMARPDISIDWVVEDRCADLLVGHPSLRRLILLHRRDFEREFKKGSYRMALSNLLDFRKDLRQDTYTAVLDFQSLLKSGVVAFLAKGKIKLGSPSTYGKMKEWSWLFSRPVSLSDPKLHLVDRHRLVIKELVGEDPPHPPFTLGIDPACESGVLERLDQWDQEIRSGGESHKRPLALLHPFASWVTRRWPLEYFGEVSRWLIDNGYRVGVIGGGGADQEVSFLKIREVVTQNRTDAPDVCLKSFMGVLSLKESAVLMTKADIVIACDSGPMHLSSAMGVRTLGIFGPTDPVRLGPVGDLGMEIHADLLCHPCMGRRCPIGTPCMRELDPPAVIDAAIALLKRSCRSESCLSEGA